MSDDETFGFTVSKTDAVKYGPEQERYGPDGQWVRYVTHVLPDPPRWQVTLPHQCHDWTITGSYNYESAATQDAAIAEFERFIAEAQQALEALQAGREFGGPER